MFKGAALYFTEPICGCDEESIGWALGDKEVVFRCKICKTTLSLPLSSFRMKMVFDNPYPGKPQEIEAVLLPFKPRAIKGGAGPPEAPA